MVSFFPPDFDPQAKIALLAGRGDYPRLVWDVLQGQCSQSILFSFESENQSWLKTQDRKRCFSFNIGQVGKWLDALQRQEVRYVLLGGQIKPQRLFHGLIPDFKAIMLLASLKEKNATTIFSTLIREIEKLGITILDARCCLENQLVTPSTMTPQVASLAQPDEISHGLKICRGIADLDIGQSVVVHRGTTILVEGFDGTDAMIERAGAICNKPMGLIKLAKKTQDFRFDVPVFGKTTLEKMKVAGIQWAVLDSLRTVMLHKEEILDLAQQYNIALEGTPEDG